MKLITELNEEVQYIEEAKENGEKKLYIEGIFLQSAIKNRNGRIYPEEVMDKEVARYIKESIEKNSAMGELNHPSGPQINLDRVSHKIVSLRKEGTNYVGKALIANTPMGDIAKGLIESGIRIGVSSRGMGTVKMNKQGINEVQNDFRLATAADIVSDPSAPDAFVNGIMENVDWIYNEKRGWQMVDLAEQAKKQIEFSMRAKQLEEQKFNIFKNFLSELSKTKF